jgi:hypothetical protein
LTGPGICAVVQARDRAGPFQLIAAAVSTDSVFPIENFEQADEMDRKNIRIC